MNKTTYVVSAPVWLVPCKRTCTWRIEASSEAEAIDILRKQLASDAYTEGEYAGQTPMDNDEHYNLVEELDEPLYHYYPNDPNWGSAQIEAEEDDTDE